MLRNAAFVADLLVTIERCGGLMGTSASGRLDHFAKPSGNDCRCAQRTAGVDVKLPLQFVPVKVAVGHTAYHPRLRARIEKRPPEGGLSD